MNTLSTTFSTPLKCPIFPACSGCSTMGATEEIEERLKIEGWAKERGLVFKMKSHSPYGYRIRTKLPCREIYGGAELGLFKKGTHDLVPMPRCPLHTDSINQIIAPLKKLLNFHQIKPFNEKDHSGLLRAVQITDNRKGNLQIALSLFVMKKDLEAFFQDLLQLQENLSLWINLHPNPTANAIFSDHWEHVGGDKDFWIRFGKEEFPFHPGSFLQSNPSLFEVLLSDLAEKIPPQSRILDLFAGVGVIGAQIESSAKEVTLIEENLLCEEMFDLFQKRAKHPNLHFKAAGAEDISLFNTYDVLIVDPPRKGLAKQFKELLKASSIEKVLYVSCGFSSLQRDIEDLKEVYELVDLKGYLLFPGTDQVETVAELRRK